MQSFFRKKPSLLSQLSGSWVIVVNGTSILAQSIIQKCYTKGLNIIIIDSPRHKQQLTKFCKGLSNQLYFDKSTSIKYNNVCKLFTIDTNINNLKNPKDNFEEYQTLANTIQTTLTDSISILFNFGFSRYNMNDISSSINNNNNNNINRNGEILTEFELMDVNRFNRDMNEYFWRLLYCSRVFSGLLERYVKNSREMSDQLHESNLSYIVNFCKFNELATGLATPLKMNDIIQGNISTLSETMNSELNDCNFSIKKVKTTNGSGNYNGSSGNSGNGNGNGNVKTYEIENDTEDKKIHIMCFCQGFIKSDNSLSVRGNINSELNGEKIFNVNEKYGMSGKEMTSLVFKAMKNQTFFAHSHASVTKAKAADHLTSILKRNFDTDYYGKRAVRRLSSKL